MLNIEILCKFMANESLGSPLDRLIHLYNTTYGGGPLNSDYDALIYFMRESSWNSGTVLAGGRWSFTNCNISMNF